MNVIRPTTLTDAMLISSNVAETAPAAYAGGTTYALGDTASIAGAAGLITVYESLQNGNTGHAPASSPTWWQSLSETYQAWASGTTYAMADRVLLASTHKIYESIQAGNTNHDPAADLLLETPLWWKIVGATNRWAMFDQLAGQQTSQTTDIEITVQPGRIDSVAFINVDVETITIEMLDGATVVYSRTLDMSLDNVFDWFEYFYEPIVRKTDAVLTDLPVYGSATIHITLTSGIAGCGEILFGMKRFLGEMLWKPKVGVLDYSRKEVDEYGNPQIVRRRFAKLMDCALFIKNPMVDEVHRLLTELRATPVVWDGSDIFTSTAVFGFYRDFDVQIESPAGSHCSLTIEGMT